MVERTYYVYLLANWDNKVMYVGMTNDLERRIFEHKEKTVKGFTEKYNVNKLVYFEHTNDVGAPLPVRKKSRNGGEKRKTLWWCGSIPIGAILAMIFSKNTNMPLSVIFVF